MKFTKQQQKEVTKVYETWLNSYLNGDVKTYDFYLDEKYHFIGSTSNEEFLNREDTTNFFKATADQLAGKTDIKNNVRTIEYFEGLVFITEVFDAWLLMDTTWSYYGRFRFTSVLRKKSEGWRFIYQHFSMPDSKAQEGETLGAEQISKENEELRDAIKRRTVELEHKNRELEIEASLERIRARTMAMHSSEELNDVLSILFQQFDVLGIKPLNVWLSLYNLEENTFTYRATGTGGSRVQGQQVIDLGAMDIWQEQLEQWKSGNAKPVLVTFYPPEVLPQLMEVFKETFDAMPAEERMDPKLFPDGGYNVQGYTKFGYIGYNHLQAPTQEEKDILLKFATEFERVYQRFLEIKKAEGQAREAQIEASLERIRARAMAMQSSEELHDVLCVLFQQFDVLGIQPISAFLSLFSSEERELTYRATGTSGARTQGSQTVSIDSLEVWKELYDKWKTDTSEDVEVIFYPKEILPKLFELFEETFSSMPVDERMSSDHFPEGGYTMHGHTRFGYIGYNHTRLPTEEEKEILTKFATEFERVYQRFLDIEKAEAQARQAQIEAALERVRTRTMAMHNTEDIAATVTTFFIEIMGLGLGSTTRSGIGILSQSEKMKLWTASVKNTSEVVLHAGLLDMTVHPLLQGVKKAWQAGAPNFTYELRGEDKLTYFRAINKAPEYPIKIDLKKLPETVYHCSFPFKDGTLFVFSDELLKDDIQDIFKRFTAVFGQTYTRYLDLQKAEAQAREAQIEAALERIRARAMAMHSSEELNDVLGVLFDQFDILGINPVWAHLSLIDLKNNTFTYRMTGRSGKRSLTKQVIDLNAREEWKESLENFKKGKPNSVSCLEYRPEALPQIWALFDETLSALPEEGKVYLEDFPDGLFNTQGYCKFGYIGFNHNRKATEEEKSIVARFATEFGRIYQRYLDIEKAEAQAREAQIEVSLERIRARSMAMHSSEELNDVLRVMFQQIEALGIDAKCAHLTLMDLENNSFSFRITGKNGAANIGEQIIDLNAMPIWKETVAKWKKAKPHSHQCLVYPPKILPELWKLIATSLKSLPAKERIKISDFPNGLFDCEGHNKFGYIGFNNSRPPTEEEISIAIRFAREFERVYQRFLEIKKAEAQAREAQIETALEKVRSRSLAMHTTGEMQQVANAVYDQLRELGLEMDAVGMSGAIEAKEDYDVWIGGSSFDKPLRIPFNDATKVQRDYNRAIERRSELFARTYSGEIKKEYTNHLLSHGLFPEDLKKLMLKSDAFSTSISFAKNSSIQIARYTGQPYSETENEILIRFGKVFEQAYIRFMDLQKAEAQAREAEIETALEKVRSQSLAMHSTSEMQLVANAIYEQLIALGLRMDYIGMSGVIEAKKDYDVWVGGASIDKPLRIPYNEDTKVQRDYNQVIEERPELFTRTYSGNIKKAYINRLLSTGDFPKAVRKKMESSKAFSTMIAPTKNSGIQIVRYTDQSFAEEEGEILKRFARVFEQAYIRFMDLQKAEAQARESQIEMALEKVRSRTMAMHQSEELGEVASVMFEQISTLTNTPDRFNIGITNETDKSIDVWVTDQNGHEVNQLFVARADKSPVISAFFNARKTKKTLAMDLHGKALKEWVQYMNKEVGIPFKEEQLKEHRYINSVFFSHGFVGVTTNEPLAQETVALIGRFAKVFQQTYVRFLDLQKAESQAREAHIQLALERVRARSMAMQSSDELSDVLSVLFKQFDELGILPVNVWLSLFNIEENTFTYRATGTGGSRVQRQQLIDMGAMDIWKQTLEHWQRGKPESILVTLYPPDIFPQMMEIFKETFDAMPEEERISPDSFPNGLYNVQGYCKFGYIGFNHNRPPSEEEENILRKFATEFERVYQRFLDIEQAEAQTRESQIQLSLERVRARSLAMQSSDELHDVLAVLFQQFDKLGIHPVNVFLSLFDREARTLTYRASGKSGTRIPGKQLVEVDSMEPLKTLFDKWLHDNSDAVEVIYYPKEALPELFGIFADTFASMPEEDRMGSDDFPDGGYSMAGYTPFGYLGYDHQRKATEEEKDILSRFCVEFTRVYQRFLDLQRSESQAREARIEAALERVRSASMAMHQTEDIGTVVVVFFDQLKHLHIPFEQAWINIFRLDEGYLDTWFSPVDGIYPEPTYFKLPSGPWEETAIKSWKSGAPFSYMSLGTKVEVDQFLEACDEITDSNYFTHVQKKLRNHRLEFLEARHKYGFISITSKEKPPKEDEEILQRFAKVFEQTYTRFSDIEKAEEQAKEAQIEAALEKVRSRSLAMQKPEELQEVVTVVGEKLQELGVILDSGGVVICTYYPVSKDVMHWTATFDSTHPSVPYYLPYFDTPIWKETWASKWESDDDFFEKVFSFEDKNHFFQKAFEISDYKNLPEAYKKQLLESENHALSFAWQANSALMIPSHNGKLLPAEHKTILKRFAKVFEQAYIRFMDLEKAEAQARESKIEMALERVRSRTMAMHKSEELGEVAAVLFEQISTLTYAPERFNIAIGNKEEESFDIWVTDQKGHEVSKRFMFQVNKSPVVREVFKAWEKEPYIVQDLHGKKLQEWVRYMQEEIGLPFDKARLSEHRYINSVFFSHGCIGITTNEPPEAEILELIGRFAKVFQQTYVRFLDLQKAEAQARESQIEVALERVR
ncbi:nuclear transport factor 2 family protein, partial [Muriicola sp.]|uniref:nuclear transport factor 2 family protein n=1 Tax=Muriicola sp. TaxID=2020856 RepID=UPI003C7914CB